MRIALIFDIHGNLPVLEAVAAWIRRRGADLVVNFGDSLSGPLFPMQTAEDLMAEGWLSLAGNPERQMLTGTSESWIASDRFARAALGQRQMAWLASLRPRLQLNEEVFLCHGTPSSREHPPRGNPVGARPAVLASLQAASTAGASSAIAIVQTGHLLRVSTPLLAASLPSCSLRLLLLPTIKAGASAATR